MRIFLIFPFLFVFAAYVFSSEKYERPCLKSDLVGTWELSVVKSKGQVPESAQDLIAAYQARTYKSDNTFLQLSSNNKLSQNQTMSLLSIPQGQTYIIDNGIITTLDNTGNVLEQYSCSYFFKDFPKGNIKKGTLSLLWYKDDQSYILNTYTRMDKSNLTSHPSGR
jgi:hypothetical protein